MLLKKLNIFIFFGIIIILSTLTFLLPKTYFSETENRVLASLPEFNLSSYIDRTFMDSFDKYFSDHFFLRDDWITMKTQMEVLLGQKEINGVYVLNDRMIEKIDKSNDEYVKNSVDAINTFYSNYKNPVIFMLVPTSQEIYKDSIPFKPSVLNQNYFIDQVYNKLNSGITKLDAYTPLNLSKDRYIYYRTDHHWTSLGAAIVYNSIGKSLGFEPIAIDKFNIEHASYDFKGTLHSKALYNNILSDVIDLYYYDKVSKIEKVQLSDGKKVYSSDSIFFKDKLNSKNKYDVFLNGNEPVVNITTSNKNGKKLLIFKDSYANSFIQFLSNHYEQITLIDLRYLNISFENYVNVDDYTQTLFLYNFKNFVTENNIRKINIKK